jgi:hypothetical protein
MPAGSHTSGIGRGLLIGFRSGPLSLEAKLFDSYHLGGLPAGLRGESTEGTLTEHTAVLRYSVGGALRVTGFLGAGMAQAPVVALYGAPGLGFQVASRPITGIGGAGGLSAGLDMGALSIDLEASAMVLYWDATPAHVVLDSGTGLGPFTYHTVDEQLAPVPITIGLSVRLTM